MLPGTIYAVLTYRIDSNIAWDVRLYRKKENGYRDTELGWDMSKTLRGAKYCARRLYRRYLKRKKIGDGHTITMILGKD
jgi:hypothetical protein